MTISRIWHAFGLQPHRTETFKLSPDLLLIAGPITANNIVKRQRPEVGLALNVPSGRSSFPTRSPAASLSTIKVDVAPTLPLDADQYKAPLKAVPRVISDHTKAAKVHALIRCMRFTGLATGDAVTLEREKIKWDGPRKAWRVVRHGRRPG
jgi:hypothetical protein